MFRVRLRSLRRAFATWPNAEGWRYAFGIGLAYFAVALSLGFATDLLRIGAPNISGWKLASLAAILLLKPCLFEEALYRALLSPHPCETLTPPRRALFTVVSLFVFVVAHPVNGAFFRPAAYATFTNPAFIVIVTLLGIACLTTYHKTGSIWPAVVIHWITVTAWILFLGGIQALGGR